MNHKQNIWNETKNQVCRQIKRKGEKDKGRERKKERERYKKVNHEGGYRPSTVNTVYRIDPLFQKIAIKLKSSNK